MAAERIMSGGAEIIVAGGTESMSMIPMGGHKISPNPWLVDHYPDAYLTMGLTAGRKAARGPVSFPSAKGSKLKRQEIVLKVDEGPRADTSIDALLALKPVFHAKGTVTAGHSSQTSDGAAAAVVMSAERAP